ncbi:MAG: hypothetical protein QNJ92_12515 [Alphaproteobacteria bacterium]|nr:hypothetical protein [Alphaproteobacteria bacterium]
MCSQDRGFGPDGDLVAKLSLLCEQNALLVELGALARNLQSGPAAFRSAATTYVLGFGGGASIAR